MTDVLPVPYKRSAPGSLPGSDRLYLNEELGKIQRTTTGIIDAVTFKQTGAGAVTRTVASRALETISALDFDVDPSGANDSSAGLQAWLNQAMAHGGCARLPHGLYNYTTPLVANLSGLGILDTEHITILGDGPGSTWLQFNDGTAAAGLTVSGAAGTFLSIEGISFGGIGTVGGQGIVLNGCSFSNLKDCHFSGFDNALLLQDSLSNYLLGCVFNFNNVGLLGRFGTTSFPNAVSCYSCVFGHHTSFGAQLLDCTNVDFRGGSIEGNGASGSFAAVQIVNTSTAPAGNNGAVAANFDGVYFEANQGAADIWFIGGFAPNPTSLRVAGCNFNRSPDTPTVTTNNIRADIDAEKTQITLIGNGHRGFNGYTPSSGRPYVNVVSSSNKWNVVDLGNVYASDLEKPVIPGPVKSGAAMASCWCNFDGTTTGTITPAAGFNVGTLVRNSVGDYTLTFGRPLANATYSLIGSTSGVSAVVNWTPTTSSINFRTFDATSTLADFNAVNIAIFGGGDLT